MTTPSTMPTWDSIFREQGYLFVDPHPDMARIAVLFKEHGVKRVLDLGCGTGRHLVYLSRLDFQMDGLDSSSHALALSNRWLDEEGLSASLREHLIERPFPYPDGMFDALISIQVIHHNLLKDIVFTVSEIERVLKPGAFVFITVPTLGLKRENHEEDWQLRQVEDGTYIPMGGRESGIPHHYFTENELREVFGSFEILEIFLDSTGHRCLLGSKRV
ncbi:MAG: hypothetical protein C4K48_12730 [Candidatus Thorarchaeota archaeon]|nr:MAG: hypothetical protein C4K48_12730 [Candidatus Thorarchaeota archaeon]